VIRAVLIVALAGCAAASPRSQDRTAPPYAALFEEGRTWRYRFRAVQRGGDAPRATEGEVTCRVAAVVFSRSTSSTIECDGAMGLAWEPVAGVWIASDEGLERGGWSVLDPRPAAGAQYGVLRDGDLWCSQRNLDRNGTRETHSLCFGAGSIVRGSFEMSATDRPTHAVQFELVE
jgi:hypothetical protein